MSAVTAVLAVYYNVISSWIFVYIIQSFRRDLPWDTCNRTQASPRTVYCQTDQNFSCPPIQHFYHALLISVEEPSVFSYHQQLLWLYNTKDTYKKQKLDKKVSKWQNFDQEKAVGQRILSYLWDNSCEHTNQLCAFQGCKCRGFWKGRVKMRSIKNQEMWKK
jgi:hypothetical protein